MMAAIVSARKVSGIVVYSSVALSLNKNSFLLSNVYLGQVMLDNRPGAVEPPGWLGSWWLIKVDWYDLHQLFKPVREDEVGVPIASVPR